MIQFSPHPLTALAELFCDFQDPKCVEYTLMIRFSPHPLAALAVLFCDFQHPRCVKYR
jgi:hypothetical protein